MTPDDWKRIEVLWDVAAELPPNERDALFKSHAIEGALREEFESLLARANAAQSFFGRLRNVVGD